MIFRRGACVVCRLSCRFFVHVDLMCMFSQIMRAIGHTCDAARDGDGAADPTAPGVTRRNS